MKDVLADVANRARTIHAVIANDLAPHGGRLACRVCGRVVALATDDVARYLAAGWPTCCARGMAFEPSAAPGDRA